VAAVCAVDERLLLALPCHAPSVHSGS
jgi:hypothetical protein